MFAFSTEVFYADITVGVCKYIHADIYKHYWGSESVEMEIVLDKSYLYRAGQRKLSDLCFSNQVLMPEALFYELLTTSPENRAKCFSNLPAVDNPLILVKNVGFILRTEVKNKIPFTNIKDATLNIKVHV